MSECQKKRHISFEIFFLENSTANDNARLLRFRWFFNLKKWWSSKKICMDVLQKASYLFLKYFFISNSKFKGTKRQPVFRRTLNFRNILIFKVDMTFFLRHSYRFFHTCVHLSCNSMPWSCLTLMNMTWFVLLWFARLADSDLRLGGLEKTLLIILAFVWELYTYIIFFNFKIVIKNISSYQFTQNMLLIH